MFSLMSNLISPPTVQECPWHSCCRGKNYLLIDIFPINSSFPLFFLKKPQILRINSHYKKFLWELLWQPNFIKLQSIIIHFNIFLFVLQLLLLYGTTDFPYAFSPAPIHCELQYSVDNAVHTFHTWDILRHWWDLSLG